MNTTIICIFSALVGAFIGYFLFYCIPTLITTKNNRKNVQNRLKLIKQSDVISKEVFNDCISIENAPEFSKEVLTKNCIGNIFHEYNSLCEDCKNLNFCKKMGYKNNETHINE